MSTVLKDSKDTANTIDSSKGDDASITVYVDFNTDFRRDTSLKADVEDLGQFPLAPLSKHIQCSLDSAADTLTKPTKTAIEKFKTQTSKLDTQVLWADATKRYDQWDRLRCDIWVDSERPSLRTCLKIETGEVLKEIMQSCSGDNIYFEFLRKDWEAEGLLDFNGNLTIADWTA